MYDLTGNTEGLNPDFLTRLKALGHAVGKLNVHSGYRSPGEQANVFARYGAPRAAPPGHSQHELGMAADLAGNIDLAHRLASHYGIAFPISSEPWHAQPVRGRAAGGQATGRQNVQQVGMPFAASAQPSPVDRMIAQYGGQHASAPADAADKLRSLFGDQTAAPAKLPDFDPPRKQHPDDLAAAGLDPNRMYTGAEMRAALNIAQAKATPDPNAASIARLRSQATAQDTMANRMGALPVPQEEEFNMPALPQRATEAIPQRQERPSTFGRAAAALAGLIAPQAAGEFGAAELGGEQEAGQQRYSDALTRYKLATARDDQEYDDALQRSQMTGQNTMRNQQIRYGNQQNRYNAAVDEIMRRGGASQAGDEASQLTALGAAQQPYNILAARVGNFTDQQKQAQLMEQWQAKVDQAALARENALMGRMISGDYSLGRARMTGDYGLQRTQAQQTGQNKRNAATNETRLGAARIIVNAANARAAASREAAMDRAHQHIEERANASGYHYVPGTAGRPARFDPLPANALSLQQRQKLKAHATANPYVAELSALREQAVNARAEEKWYADQLKLAGVTDITSPTQIKPHLKPVLDKLYAARADAEAASASAKAIEKAANALRTKDPAQPGVAGTPAPTTDPDRQARAGLAAGRAATSERMAALPHPKTPDEARKLPRAASPRPLDEATAHTILQQAGGDKAKARKIAKQRGYSF